MNEKQFHQLVANWLHEHNYDYQHEVRMPSYGRADFVAKDAQGQVWIVECKVGKSAKDGRSIIQLADYCRQIVGSKGFYAIPANLRSIEIDELCGIYDVTLLPIHVETVSLNAKSATGSNKTQLKHRGDLAEAILLTARQQLQQRGNYLVSLRAIAKELEITPSAIYRYYATHEDLIEVLTGVCVQDFVDALEIADRTIPVNQYERRMTVILEEYRNWALQHTSEFYLVYERPRIPYEEGSITLPHAHLLLEIFIRILNGAALAGSLNVSHLQDDESFINKGYLVTLEKRSRYEVSPIVATIGFDVWSRIYALVMSELRPNTNPFGELPSVYYNHAIKLLVKECRFLA